MGHVGRGGVIARSATQATLTKPIAPRNTVVERFITRSLKRHGGGVDHPACNRGGAKRDACRQFTTLNAAGQI